MSWRGHRGIAAGDHKAYLKLYDPEKNYLNNLPDQDDLAEMLAEERQREQELFDARKRAQQAKLPSYDTFQHPNVGKFIIVQSDKFEDHLACVKSPKIAIGYDVGKYKFFDKVFAEALGEPALLNSVHPKYPRLDGVRNNVAVIRNYVYSTLFPDGSFDPNDESKARLLSEMAWAIGKAMQRDTIFRIPGTRSLSQARAMIEGEGAQAIYELLQKVQNDKILFNPMTWFGRPNKKWGLPPIDKTPFSAEKIAAARNNPDLTVCLTQDCEGKPLSTPVLPAPPVSPSTEEKNYLEEKPTGLDWLELSDAMEATAYRLRTVESLDEPVKQESVEIAREILRKLKFKLGAPPAENGLNLPNEEENFLAARLIANAAYTYEKYVEAVAMEDPAILNSVTIIEAQQAVGQFAYIFKQQALRELEKTGNTSAAEAVKASIAKMPPEWKNLQGKSLRRVLDNLDDGIMHTLRFKNKEVLQMYNAQITAKSAEQVQRDLEVMSQNLAQQETVRKRAEKIAKTISQSRDGLPKDVKIDEIMRKGQVNPKDIQFLTEIGYSLYEPAPGEKISAKDALPTLKDQLLARSMGAGDSTAMSRGGNIRIRDRDDPATPPPPAPKN